MIFHSKIKVYKRFKGEISMNLNELLDFNTWGVWHYVIAGAILLLLLFILFLIFMPNKKVKPVKNNVPLANSNEALKTKPSDIDQSPLNDTETEKPKEVKVTPIEKAPQMDEVKEPKKSVSTPKEETLTPTEDTPKETVKKTNKPSKYHISQNKDEDSEFSKMWRVRKEGSSKTIKYFKTQKEAITFAEKLAENQDSSIVIHKKDGSIRKQDYTKKES